MRSKLAIMGVPVLLIIPVGITLAVKHWPFTRESVLDALQEGSSRTVKIDRFQMTYFPPGCIAEGISFLHRKHKEKPPLITVQKLVVRGSYSGLLASPNRLTEVRVVGMHVTVPPRNPDGTNPIMPLTDVKSRRPFVVETVTSDGVVLDFMSSQRGKEAYKLLVDKLVLGGVGNDQSISYRATIANTEPPGEIHATGRFGPWNADDPGRTSISGAYTFDNADLGVFKDLAGILTSNGQFSGTLDHIEVAGHSDVPNFHVAHSGHAEHVTSDFKAVVNATDGDTFLEDVKSHFSRTTLVSNGSVAGRPGEKGKTVLLDVTSAGARVEDLLNLLVAAKRSPLTGDFTMKAKIALPPAHEAFLQKLKVDGDFGLAAGEFTSRDTQQTLNKLSTSARKDATHEEKEDPETALSNLKGHVTANNGLATLTNVSFSIPGASAKVNGTYNLLTQDVNLHGVLSTVGKIYVTQKGFSSLLLRAITPFLKHKEHTTVVPFKITGVYPNASIALDLFGTKEPIDVPSHK